MNEFPPPNEGLEEVDERYRRLSNRDPSRPSEATRRAVLQHAAELARHRTEANSVPIGSRLPSANRPHWRVATYGGLAAAALAGLLIAPHFLTTSTGPMTRPSPPPVHTPEPGAARPATPAAAESDAFAGADARRATSAQGPARESAPPPRLAQMQAVGAPSAARAGASSPPPAAPSPGAGSLDAATALREAAQSGNITRLNALLAERIDIDARDANGRSALMLAVLHDQQQAVNSLLAAGADPNAADSTGTRPLQAAIVGARPEIVAALRRAGAR